MASAQVVETSVTNNSPSQDSYHPDDLFQSRYATPGFKPFSYLVEKMSVPMQMNSIAPLPVSLVMCERIILIFKLNNNDFDCRVANSFRRNILARSMVISIFK